MHHPQNIWVLIAVAVFTILRALAAKPRRSQRPDPAPSPPADFPETATSETDTERMRELLEALGQPPGANPPRRVEPRTHLPPRPVAPIEPPRSMRGIVVPRTRDVVAAQRPAESRAAEWGAPELPRRSVTISKMASAAGRFPRVAAPEATPRAGGDVYLTSLRDASPTELRRAILLREILGPPRAFAEHFAG